MRHLVQVKLNREQPYARVLDRSCGLSASGQKQPSAHHPRSLRSDVLKQIGPLNCAGRVVCVD